MKKTILTEKDIKNLVYKITEEINTEEELDEVFGGTALGDMYQGIRGYIKGETYGYFKYLSKIKNRSKKVIKELEDAQKFTEELKKLKPNIEKLTIAPEKRQRLLNLLDHVTSKGDLFFPSYVEAMKEINKLTDEKLSGKRLDVVPGSKSNQLGKDLMKSKDNDINTNDTEVVDFESKSSLNKQGSVETTKKNNKKSDDEKKLQLILPPNLKEEITRFKEMIK